MGVVGWHGHELGQALAEPHGDVPLHVDGKGFEALLQAADSEVAQRANVLAQVDAGHLRRAQTAHQDEPWAGERRGEDRRGEEVSLLWFINNIYIYIYI